MCLGIVLRNLLQSQQIPEAADISCTRCPSLCSFVGGYTYMHICVSICQSLYIHICIFAYTHVCICVCVYLYIHMCAQTHTCPNICLCVSILICLFLCLLVQEEYFHLQLLASHLETLSAYSKCSWKVSAEKNDRKESEGGSLTEFMD